MVKSSLPPVAESPVLLERGSMSRLRKEIESREPEGPQDSTIDSNKRGMGRGSTAVMP